MMSEKKVPAIRFRGFEDDWEQRKVGDITIESTEYTTLDAGYPLLTSSRAGLMYQNEYRGNLTTDSKETLFSVVPIGACTYRHMSDDDVFHLNINTLEKGLVSREYPVFFATKENCLNFIIQYINSSASFRAFCAEQKKGGTRTRLYYNALCEFKMMVPSKREQEVIAGYLLSLDHLITLHQRKLEKLKIVKKSMLVNCFPKNGEKVPKFRFSGFTGDWEQRKSVDIADYSKGNGYSKSDLTENGTPIILYGRLYTKYQFAIDEVDTFATPKDGSIYSQGNEVIIPASGETAEDIARASAVEKSGILLGGDLNILRPFNFINPLFLALTISNGEPQKELAKKAQGKSVVHIHNSDIQEVTVSFPIRAEQDRIVAVFRSLDNLITLHQRELKKLQMIKKSMLRSMFV